MPAVFFCPPPALGGARFRACARSSAPASFPCRPWGRSLPNMRPVFRSRRCPPPPLGGAPFRGPESSPSPRNAPPGIPGHPKLRINRNKQLTFSEFCSIIAIVRLPINYELAIFYYSSITIISRFSFLRAWLSVRIFCFCHIFPAKKRYFCAKRLISYRNYAIVLK